LSERLEKARKAYKDGDMEATREAHKNAAIAEEHKLEQGKYLGDIVNGAIGVIMTTFAVVSGVVGAASPRR
jgi:hypothetical protein